MRRLPAVTATLFAIFVAFIAPTAASRFLVPLHKQGAVHAFDDCRQTPNVAFRKIPGVNGIASDRKFLAAAITDGTGFSRQPEIVLLDVRQSAPLATIRLPGAGGHVAVSPNSRFAAVVHPDLGSVSIVNLHDRKIQTTLAIDGAPKDLIFSHDSQQLFLSDSDTGRLFVISMAFPTVSEAIEGLGTTGHRVMSSDGALLYAANDGAGTINVISLEAKKQLSTLNADGEIHGIDISPNGETIYAADFEGNKVITINIATEQRQAIDIQPAPYHITTMNDTGQIVVTSAEQEVMKSIAVPSIMLIGKYGLEGITD